MNPPSDDELFRRLFEAHFDDLWRFARRRCASAADADDVAAQVFAVAWRRRHELPDDGIRLWLFGVARHVLANQRRGDERRRRLQLRLLGDHRDDHHASLDSHDLVAGQGAELRAALASLGDDDRDVVIMRCWDGLAVTEIATILGCTPNAVSVRLHKARRKLTDRLGRPGRQGRPEGDRTDPALDGHVPVDPQPREEDRHGRQ